MLSRSGEQGGELGGQLGSSSLQDVLSGLEEELKRKQSPEQEVCISRTGVHIKCALDDGHCTLSHPPCTTAPCSTLHLCLPHHPPTIACASCVVSMCSRCGPVVSSQAVLPLLLSKGHNAAEADVRRNSLRAGCRVF